MDDDLEDKIFYQTYISYAKLLTKFAVGLPTASTAMASLWRLCRLYVIRPDVLFCAIILFVLIFYLQAVELWSRGLMGRISNSFGGVSSRRVNRMQLLHQSPAEKQSWEIQQRSSAVYAVQGRRPKMEDRFVIHENVDNTGVALFAIFDGHGGDFAAEFAKTCLIQSLTQKIVETSKAMRGIQSGDSEFNYQRPLTTPNSNHNPYDSPAMNGESIIGKEAPSSSPALSSLTNRRASFKKSYSTADDCGMNVSNCNREQDVFMDKLNSIIRTKDQLFGAVAGKEVPVRPQTFEARSYIEAGKINFGKMMSDEVLAADCRLVEIAKKKTLLAGTTALLAIMEGHRLIVANVGDSRGVMCDSRGNAIPLSFDHKPQQVRERKRIQDAGGFIAFKGVWRVAGILATSRAMGDYPLKDKKLVIADPDILTFDLNDHKPNFLVLASDGLWDTFSNEEAVAFIRSRLHEPHFGAKSLTLQSYFRGSVDNISVLVIVFKDGKYQFGSN